MTGIENIRKVVLFGAQFGETAYRFKVDEGGILSKASILFESLDELAGILTVDFSQLQAEFKDLDENEKLVLMADVKDVFDLPDDELEKRLEDTFEHGLNIAISLQALSDLWANR